MERQRYFRIGTKGVLSATVLVASFAVGLGLGRIPQSVGQEPLRSVDAVANLLVDPVNPGSSKATSTASGQAKPNVSQPARRLRLRSTTQISSREAKSGDSVLFVTEQPVHTEHGQQIPAGALVEAVVANARRSSAATPGQLVIEIRALHVGTRAIPLHALPYIPSTLPKTETPVAMAPVLADPRAVRIRTQLRVNPEAVMPKASVIEFELVESQGLYLPQNDSPDRNGASDAAPLPTQPVFQEPRSNPKLDSVPRVPTEKPALKSARISIASA